MLFEDLDKIKGSNMNANRKLIEYGITMAIKCGFKNLDAIIFS